MATAKYPVKTIAELLGLSTRRVYQLVVKGVLPKSEHGKYDLVGCVQGYCKHMREQMQGQDSASLTEERILLTRENRMKVARINKILDRDFVPVPMMEKSVIKLIAEIDSMLGTLGSKCIVALELCKTPAEKQEVIDRNVDDLRAEFRSLDIDSLVAEACDAGVEIATKAKPKSMGRGKRVSKPRKQRRNG